MLQSYTSSHLSLANTPTPCSFSPLSFPNLSQHCPVTVVQVTLWISFRGHSSLCCFLVFRTYLLEIRPTIGMENLHGTYYDDGLKVISTAGQIDYCCSIFFLFSELARFQCCVKFKFKRTSDVHSLSLSIKLAKMCDCISKRTRAQSVVQTSFYCQNKHEYVI